MLEIFSNVSFFNVCFSTFYIDILLNYISIYLVVNIFLQVVLSLHTVTCKWKIVNLCLCKERWKTVKWSGKFGINLIGVEKGFFSRIFVVKLINLIRK